MKTCLIIPTYNAGAGFETLLQELDRQSMQPDIRLVVDSSSQDGTGKLAETYGWQLLSISPTMFSHGGTRSMALRCVLERMPADIAIYITQDVRMPDKDALACLVNAFADPAVAAAYGRQLPHIGASIYAAVDREYNYPPRSQKKSMADADKLGLKTAFFSDSFAAYRVSSLSEIGWMPAINICEDMYVAGKLLLAGYQIAYVAEAQVHHSHEPKTASMWQRYRNVGKFQRQNAWLKENFGRAGGEGMKLLRYQLGRVAKEKGVCGIIKILYLDAVRFLAYHLG